MSDLLKVSVGGSSYLCKFSYPEPLPTGYKRVKYIELTGTGSPITTSSFRSDKILQDLRSIDTVEVDLYLPNSQSITSSAKFTVFSTTNSWSSGTAGNLTIWNDTINMKFQEYREIAASNLDNLGKQISIKRSARAVQPGDEVPSGYYYVGQLTVNDVLYEHDRYNHLQSIDIYTQNGSFFEYANSGSDPYSGIAGTKIYKLTMKEYLTDIIKYDFIPCIRESDLRPGFYEPVHDYFLISRDNGVWSAGPLK